MRKKAESQSFEEAQDELEEAGERLDDARKQYRNNPNDKTKKNLENAQDAFRNAEDDVAGWEMEYGVRKVRDRKEASRRSSMRKKARSYKVSLDRALEKFAKMNNQTKTMLREYYKQYYPADYVEALLAEK